jgi:hypothetical protein
MIETKLYKISDIKPNPSNPRTIKDDKFLKLVNSIKQFPEMLKIRPIVINEDNVVLGGNMRLKACIEAKLKEIPVIMASDLTEDQQREFIIKDNVGFGEWDWQDLAINWNPDKLEEWGLDVPEISETEKLSELKFEDIYFNPVEVPNIKLSDCLDLEKFNKKIEIINNAELTEDQKSVLTFFAYRFIKIDFENVANYYYFNADENEKNVIERLRLVLCDSGINGFIEDDLLRVHQLINEWSND